MLKSSSPVQRAQAAHALLRVRSMELDLNEIPQSPSAKRPRLGHKRPRLQTARGLRSTAGQGFASLWAIASAERLSGQSPWARGTKRGNLWRLGSASSASSTRTRRTPPRGRSAFALAAQHRRRPARTLASGRRAAPARPGAPSGPRSHPGKVCDSLSVFSFLPEPPRKAAAKEALQHAEQADQAGADNAKQLSAMLRSFRAQRHGSHTADNASKLTGVQSRLWDMARRHASQDRPNAGSFASAEPSPPSLGRDAPEDARIGRKFPPAGRDWSISSDGLLFDLNPSPITTDDRASSSESHRGDDATKQHKRSAISDSRRLSIQDVVGQSWFDSNQEVRLQLGARSASPINASGPVPSFSMTFGSRSYEDPWNRWDLDSDPLTSVPRSLGLSKELARPSRAEPVGVSFDTIAAQVAEIDNPRLSDSKLIPPKISQLKVSRRVVRPPGVSLSLSLSFGSGLCVAIRLAYLTCTLPPRPSKGSSASKIETVGTFELDDVQKADIGDIG
eukprot:scaffold32_cov200-Pinguiococcus_pyrenoidosus.AAC.2